LTDPLAATPLTLKLITTAVSIMEIAVTGLHAPSRSNRQAANLRRRFIRCDLYVVECQPDGQPGLTPVC
jgi:hypothetical protein